MRDLIKKVLKEHIDSRMKLIEDLYVIKTDVNLEEFNKFDRKTFTTIVKFVPRNADNHMSPSVVLSETMWEYFPEKSSKYSLEFLWNSYARGDEMPVLKYMGNIHFLDDYTDEIHEDLAEDVLNYLRR
jgi:hypothetical protein